MKIVLQTQFMENYGAHDWDGQGECPQYWKPKGGDTYVIENLTEEQIASITNNNSEISNLIEYKRNSSEEYIVSLEVVNDDVQKWEDWETPIKIEMVNKQYVATQITPNDEFAMLDEHVKEKICSYVMKPAGKKENYTTVYVMKNGDIVNYENMVSYMSEVNKESEKSNSNRHTL